jgi:hypothetical protein
MWKTHGFDPLDGLGWVPMHAWVGWGGVGFETNTVIIMGWGGVGWVRGGLSPSSRPMEDPYVHMDL